MAGIFANIDSDIDKLRKLKSEIDNVKKALQKINVKVDIDIAQDLEARLKGLMTQYDALAQKVAQTDAKIAESTARINKSAEAIVKAQEQMTKAAVGQGAASTQGVSGGNAAATNAQTASVEAQAKAYDELKDAIEDYLGTMEGNARFIAESRIRIKAINSDISAIEKSIKSQGHATEAQTKDLAKYIKKLAETKLQMQDARREFNTGLRINVAGEGSLAKLRNQLLQMQRVWDVMAESVRNSQIGQEFAKSIDVLNKQVSELEQTMGRYQRNVGNYASGWNGLNMSIQQIGRELPSLAMGWNTFFLAISNNLPILSDEIKRAKDEYNNLKKAGTQATPVWKQVVSSLISWQTALTVGITLLTMYGSDIIDWVGNLFKAKEQLDLGKESLKAFNEAMLTGGKNAQQEITTLNLLYNATQNTAKGMNERLNAVEQLQKQYPSYFANFSKEDILAGKAADSYVRLAQSITASARAQAARNSIVEQQSKVLENEQKINDAYTRLQEAENKLQEIRDFYQKQQKEGFGTASSKLNTENAIIQAETNIKSIEKEIAGYRTAIYQANKISKNLEKNINIDDLLFDSKGTNQEQAKAVNNLKSYLDELAKLQEDNEDRQIDLMEEGTEKQLAEIDLRYRRIRDKVKELEANLSKEQGGKLTDEQTAAFIEAYNNIDRQQQRDRNAVNVKDDTLKAQREAMNRYLQDYGTFQQKQQAITEEYNRKIAEATTEGDKLSLQKQMEEALSSLDLEKLKKSINWELVFSDLSNASKESLDKVKQQLKTFKESDEYQNMAVDQKKVIDEAMDNIQSAIIDKGGLLGDLPNQLEELRIAQEELTKAQDEYNEALKNGMDEQKEAAQGKLNKAQQNLVNQQNNVNKSTDKVVQNFRTLSDALVQLGSSSEISLSQVGSLAEGIINIFSETGSKVGGIVGTALSLLDAIGQQGLTGFVGNVFKSVGNAMYGAWNSLFGWTGIDFGGESDPHLEEDIESLTASNQALQNSIDNLSDKMDNTAVADATEIYEQQVENINDMERNTQEMMLRSLRAYSNGFLGIGGDKSSSHEVNTGISSEEWRKISDLLGKDIDEASDFFSLSSREMYDVANELPVIYGKIKDLADNGYKDAAQFMDEYIGYWKDLEELEEEYNERLTSVSFDNVRDDFKNVLLDMSSDAEDFANDFEKMMQNAIIESMMSEKYDALLKEWYNEFAQGMEDGRLSTSEKQDLKSQWDDIVSQGLADRDALKDLFGWSSGGEDTQQSASAKETQQITYDQASHIEGRLNAMYEAQLRGIELSQSTYSVAAEARDIIAQSYLELQQISENTGEIVKPIKQMQLDIAEVKRNTSRL